MTSFHLQCTETCSAYLWCREGDIFIHIKISKEDSLHKQRKDPVEEQVEDAVGCVCIYVCVCVGGGGWEVNSSRNKPRT